MLDIHHQRQASSYNGQMPDPAEKDPRVYLAVERTFLAWIRTGLALMGIGFAVSRFGLFLRQFTSGTTAPVNPHASVHSVFTGVALVILGVIVILASTVRNFRTVRQLSSGTWMPGKISRTAVVLALLLAAIGVVMAIYLVLVR